MISTKYQVDPPQKPSFFVSFPFLFFWKKKTNLEAGHAAEPGGKALRVLGSDRGGRAVGPTEDDGALETDDKKKEKRKGVSS